MLALAPMGQWPELNEALVNLRLVHKRWSWGPDIIGGTPYRPDGDRGAFLVELRELVESVSHIVRAFPRFDL